MNNLTHSSPLSLDQFANALRVHRNTVLNRLKTRGTHGARKVGQRWYFPTEALTGDLALPG